MKSFFTSLILIAITFGVSAQEVEVPEKISFAGMTLKFSHGARKKVQADVEAIMRNKKFFLLKVDRANLYFPIIEKVFKEENFPEDFKYLSLQESSLISDAVSSSKAVGYWQFKRESAVEVGLRVDNEVDERMNIVSSTRGAAKYLKKGQAVLNNWIYTLLAYNLGLGGVRPHVKEKYRGVKEMFIDDDMHWYVLRFLAHKIAYEETVGKYPHPDLQLFEYNKGLNKTLKEIASESNLPAEEIENYNKWALKAKVPADKPYIVIIPVKTAESNKYVTLKEQHEKGEEMDIVQRNEASSKRIGRNKKADRRVTPPADYDPKDVPLIVSNNNLKAIKARKGDNSAKLAYAAGISLSSFLGHNDLESFDEILPDKFYYLEPKRNKAIVLFHVLEEGETLWEVSQKYGIRINSIRKKNRMKLREVPKTGQVLWLMKKRPKGAQVEYRKVAAPKNDIVENKVVEKKDPEKKIVEKAEVKAHIAKVEEKKVELPKENSQNKTVETKNTLDEIKETLPSVKTDVEATEGEKIHEVQQGQTMFSISKIYSVSIDSLKEWNNLENLNIKIGQQLVVGKTLNKRLIEKKTLDDKKVIHTVLKGETLYNIARQYGVKLDEVLIWNNKKDYNVSIGENVLIYLK